MQTKRYKPSYFKLISGIVSALFAMIVCFYIASIFLDVTVSAIIGILIGICIIFIVISEFRQFVEINNGSVLFKHGNKINVFEIEKCKFSAYTDNNSQTIYVYDENGVKHDIDCSGISNKNFYELINDLNIIGDNSPVTKLN